jgi:hypothetical protein
VLLPVDLLLEAGALRFGLAGRFLELALTLEASFLSSEAGSSTCIVVRGNNTAIGSSELGAYVSYTGLEPVTFVGLYGDLSARQLFYSCRRMALSTCDLGSDAESIRAHAHSMGEPKLTGPAAIVCYTRREAASMQTIARVESQVQNPLRPDFPHEARTQQGK